MTATPVLRDDFSTELDVSGALLQPVNPLALRFEGVEAEVLRIVEVSTGACVLEITAKAEGLSLELIDESGGRKQLLPWRCPAPSVVSPHWSSACDSNGYEIEFPELAVKDSSDSWVLSGIRYSVHVSQQAGASKTWIKARREGPQ